jgi:heat shock protein HslJ
LLETHVNRYASVAAGFARRALPGFALTVAATLAVAACTSGAGASPSGAGASPSGASPSVVSPSGEPPSVSPALEGTAWQLTDYVGPAGSTLAVPEAVAATATFTDGTMAGNAGCNQYTATYTLDGDKITIGTPAMTAMACPEPQMALEKAYTTALAKVATYAIAGQTLELRTAEGTVGLRYKAAETPTLTKTRWVATSINTGTGATQSVVAGSTVTAIFGEDGTVAGSGGCNTYNGTYTVDGAALMFGPILSSKMACADEALTKQETNFFAALAKVTTHAFSGDNLELRDAEGALQVEFRPTLP